MYYHICLNTQLTTAPQCLYILSIGNGASVIMGAQLSFSRARFQVSQMDVEKEKCCVTNNTVFSFWSKPSP